MKNLKYIIMFFVGVAVVLLLVALLRNPREAGASVSIVDGYMSTTTSGTGVSTWAEARLVSGTTTVPRTGVFGSVIITKQTNGTTLNIYDATTTNVNLRTGQLATSSITLASFGTSTPVGTYTFDSIFNIGLLIDPMPVTGNLVASSTITWKY